MAKDVPDAPSTKQVLEQLAVIQRDLMEQNNRASMQLNSSIKEVRKMLIECIKYKSTLLMLEMEYFGLFGQYHAC